MYTASLGHKSVPKTEEKKKTKEMIRGTRGKKGREEEGGKRWLCATM